MPHPAQIRWGKHAGLYGQSLLNIAHIRQNWRKIRQRAWNPASAAVFARLRRIRLKD
jgi:hypothetical protein